MHPIPTVLLGGPQDGPECWIGQQCMRWEANPRSLLPLLEFFFGNITISFFHPVPALENFLVRNQMQLFKFAMLCNLWHEAIFPIIVIVISKLENISTLLAKAATTVSFGAPRKFGSLTIHNKKAKLQEESFANCCMPWWLLQLQSQILHIPIAAVKYRLQSIKISNWTLRSLTRRLSSSILVYVSCTCPPCAKQLDHILVRLQLIGPISAFKSLSTLRIPIRRRQMMQMPSSTNMVI